MTCAAREECTDERWREEEVEEKEREREGEGVKNR
jgi:hypothetical protein